MIYLSSIQSSIQYIIIYRKKQTLLHAFTNTRVDNVMYIMLDMILLDYN